MQAEQKSAVLQKLHLRRQDARSEGTPDLVDVIVRAACEAGQEIPRVVHADVTLFTPLWRDEFGWGYMVRDSWPIATHTAMKYGMAYLKKTPCLAARDTTSSSMRRNRPMEVLHATETGPTFTVSALYSSYSLRAVARNAAASWASVAKAKRVSVVVSSDTGS